jgi:hypothetical protein
MGIGETLSPHYSFVIGIRIALYILHKTYTVHTYVLTSLCSCVPRSPEQSNPSREFGSHPPIIDMPEREGVYEPGQLSSREHPRIMLAAKMGV